MSIRVLQNGDRQLVSGVVGTVASVTASCNASGKVTFTLPGGSTVKAFLKPAPGHSFTHTTADAYWRTGVLHSGARYCVICDDPYYCRRLSGPAAWSTCLAPWSCTVTMGDEYSVKMQRGGVSMAAGSAVDLLAYWNTNTDGGVWGQGFGGTYPYASLAWDGTTYRYQATTLPRFQTYASGFVKAFNPYDGSSGPIIVPKGWGAWGQKSGDAMHAGGDSPTAEGYLSSLYAAFRQDLRALTANGTTVFNLDAVDVTVNGPSHVNVHFYWEGGLTRTGVALGAGGSATATGLQVGKYLVHAWTSNAWQGLPAQSLLCPSAGVYTMTFGAVTHVPQLSCQGIIRADGFTKGLGGATIWGLYQSGVGVDKWTALATTAADGTFGPFATNYGGGILALAVQEDEGSAYHSGPGGSSGTWWDPTVRANLAVSPMFDGLFPGVQEGLSAWGRRGAHVNVVPPTSVAYAYNSTTGDAHTFGPATYENGMVAGPMPRWRHSGTLATNNLNLPTSPYLYIIYSADGTKVNSAVLGDDQQNAWANDGSFDCSAQGEVFDGTVGGKLDGNVVGWSSEPNDGDLPEADRMNLQWGTLNALYDRVRARRSTATSTYLRQTLTAIECPYCQGPVETEPGAATPRGYCRNCAQAFSDADGMDARTFLASPTLPALTGYGVRLVRPLRAGDTVKQLLRYHWAPEDYQDTDAYSTASGRGQPTNAPRWFGQHIHYGTYSGGVWTANEDVPTIEASQGRTLGPGRVKAVFPNGYTYTGPGVSFRAKLTRGDAAAESVLFAINTGDGRADAWGTYVPVNRVQQPAGFETNGWDARAGLYDAVTSCDVVGGTSGDVQFSLVNASPHLQATAGAAVSHQAVTPVALEWGDTIRRNPDLWFGPWRRLYLAWRNDEHEVAVQKSDDAGRTWTGGVAATPTGYDFPAIEKRITGELIVNATRAGSPSVVKTFVSRDDGLTFASTARSFAGTRFDVQPHLGAKQMGALTSGSVKYLVGLNAWSTLHGRPSGNAAATTVQTYTDATSDAGNERAAVVRQVGGRLTMALENAAGNVKFWQSSQDGLVWTSGATSVSWGKPDLAQAGHKQYLAGLSGTTHKVARGINALSTALPWNAMLTAGGTTLQASAVIASNVDAERPALVKLDAWGRPLVAAVTKGGTVEIHESRDDGLSWGRIS